MTASPRTVFARGRAVRRLAEIRILVLNWRDVRHPQAGGAETYIHEIASRWAAAGASVTFLTSTVPGLPAQEWIDGIDVRRAGGTLTVYLRAAVRLVAHSPLYDVVVDCQNGIPFFAPLFTSGRVPVVQLVHHVHQDQFATRFSPPVAAIGRALESSGSRWVYGGRRSVAVSASTRQEMRRRLRFDGIIEVVPNGGRPPLAGAAARAVDPTVVIVSRLVPHKRIDVLLHAALTVRSRVPNLRVEIIGDGPELPALRATATVLGLDTTVTFHGRLPDQVRDALLAGAWLTTSTSDGEGWGCAVLEAAAAGVPCVALHAPGIRDSVIDGRTGWLVDAAEQFPAALLRAVTEIADPARAADFADECRRWAGCFTWDRSAELLAGVLLSEIVLSSPDPTPRRIGSRRRSRSDVSTMARFTHPDPAAAIARLRLTDEAIVDGREVTAVLRGCDDLDAIDLLGRIGATGVEVRPASRHELLGGPAAVDRSVPAYRSTTSVAHR